MDMHKNKKKMMAVAIVFAIILVAVIGYRIYVHQKTNQMRAAASSTKVIQVEVQDVMVQPIVPKLTVAAILEPYWMADISTKLDARLDRLLVDEGMPVAAGQTIAILDAADLNAQLLQAQGSYYAAQANVEQAELEYVRTSKLALQGAEAVQNADNARAKRDLMLGQLQAAKGSVAYLRSRLEGTDVTAPRAGMIMKKFVDSGSFVKLGAPIVTIGDVSSFLAKASVGEAQIGQIQLGQSVELLIEALGQRFQGRVTKIAPMATLPGRTFTVEVTVPNPDQMIRMGMFGKVEIPIVPRQVVAIPAQAMVYYEDQNSVFVVANDGDKQRVIQRKIQIGYVGEGWAEVVSGLNPGEQIVVAGQNKVRDGSQITIQAVREAGQL